MMDVITWLLENWAGLVTALVAVLGALIAFFMIIPGEEPEKTLQKIVDFISAFSRK